MKPGTQATMLFAITALISVCVLADVPNAETTSPDGNLDSTTAPTGTADDVFTFVRIRYDSSGGYGESWYHYEGRDWERWETDYPRAERNLMFRLTELTSIKVDPNPILFPCA
jgi:hypothetical protein